LQVKNLKSNVILMELILYHKDYIKMPQIEFKKVIYKIYNIIKFNNVKKMLHNF